MNKTRIVQVRCYNNKMAVQIIYITHKVTTYFNDNIWEHFKNDL